MQEVAGGISGGAATSADVPLGTIAVRLGGCYRAEEAMAAVEATGTTVDAAWAVERPGCVERSQLRSSGSATVSAVVVTSVRVADHAEPVVLRGTCGVAVDGGTETTTPLGEETPTILGWSETGAQELTPGDTVQVQPTDPRDSVLYVRPARGSATAVRARASAVNSAGTSRG